MAADFEIRGELNLENVDQVTNEIARSLGKGTAEGMKLAQRFVKEFLRIGSGKNQFFKNSFKDFEAKLRSLEKRMQAMGRLAASVGVNSNIFAAADDNLEDVIRRLHQIDDLREGSDDRATRRALQAAQLQARLLGEDLQAQRKLLSLKDTINNAQAQEDKQRSRERMQADRIANAQSIVAQQTSAAQMVASTRAASQRRVEIIRASVGQIRALERGLGAVFRGTSNAIAASFSGLGRTITGALSRTRASTTRMDRQFTQGIGGALSRRESSMRSSFSRQERILSTSATRQSATIQRLERVLSGGVLGAATGRGAAAGLGFGGIGAAIGGGALGASLLTSGFQRFSELERLNKQFVALTGNQEQAVALMDEVKAFAKVTPFDLVGVADLAKGFLAMGTNAADVIPQVKTIADAVALTGGGTDELVRIQRALGQVVSAGRLQGDELNQLAENLPGLNIRKLLADQLTGGDTAALVEMQEAGEISSEMFLNGILTGLSTDTRLAGAAEALAGTLKGRFDNLKEGFADVGAALIGTIAGPMAAAFGKLQEIFSNLAQFIRGEDLSAAMNTLRTAIAGAAAAIGLLLVARAAGQAVQILAIAARALLSPFGIVIAIVGAVGAAFAVLMENSTTLRAAVTQLGNILGLAFSAIGGFFSTLFGGAGEAAEAAGNVFETIGDKLGILIRQFNSVAVPWIKETMIPALQTFATFLRETIFPAVVDGFGAAIDYIRGTVIPAFQTAFSWIADNVFPIVEGAFGAVVDFVKGTIIPGFQAFVSFMGGTVVPFIQDQLIGAFRELQDFIGNFDLSALARIGGVLAAALGGFAVAGPVGAAVAGSAAAIGLIFNNSLGDSILGGLQNLGGLISGALEGPFNTVKEFLGDFFDPDNLLDLAGGFLNLVEKVGEIVGNIASDPRVIGGLAAFAAAAAATAAKFVQGLIIGIASNLPELYALLKQAGGLALEALADALSDPGVLIKVIGGLLVGGALLNIWKTQGQKAGVAAGTGFADGLKQRAFAGMRAGAGPGAIGGSVGGFLETLFLGPKGQIDRAAKRAAETASRAFRSNLRIITAAGQSLPPMVSGPQAQQVAASMVANIDKAIGPSSAAALRIRASLKALFTGNFKALSDLAGGAFALGKSVGVKIVAGLAGAFAGAQIGSAIGKSGGSILDAILGVGGAALGAAAIGGPAGTIAAGTVVALGTITYALGANEAAAKAAAAEIAEYSDALKGLAGVDLREAATTTVLENIANESPRTRQILKQLKFDAGDFSDDIIKRGADAGAAFRDLAGNINFAGEMLAGFAGTANVQTFTDLQLLLARNSDAAKAFKDSFGAIGIGINELRPVFDFIGDEGGEMAKALGKIADVDAFRKLAADATASKGPVDILANAIALLAANVRGAQGLKDLKLLTVVAGIQAIAAEADEAREALDELFGTDYGTSLQSAIDDIIIGLENLPTALGEIDLGSLLGQAKFRGQVGGFVDSFKNAIRTGIETGEITAVPDIVVQKDTILAALTTELEKDGLTAVEAEFLWNATVTLNEITGDTTLEAILAKLFPEGVPTVETGVVVDVAATLGNVSFGDVPGATSLAEMIGARVRGDVGGGRGIPRGGVGLATSAFGAGGIPVDVPVAVTPDVTVSGDVAADVRAKILGGESTSGVVSFPVTIAPAITVAPTTTDVMGQIRARIFGGGGGNIPGVGGAVAGAGRTIPFPVTIAPSITVAPTTTDVMGQIRARIFGAGGGEHGSVGANRQIAFPVTINPQVTIGNFAAIVALGPQIINSIILGIAIGVGALSAAMQNVARVIAAAAPAARAAGAAVGAGAVQGLIAGSAPAAAAGLSLAQRFAAGIRSGTGAAVGAAQALGRAASSAVGVSTSGARNAGVNLGNALAEGIRAGQGAAVQAAVRLANAVAQAARAALQITSPSKVFHKIGTQSAEGLGEGLESGIDMMHRRGSGIIATLAKAAAEMGQTVGQSVVEGLVFGFQGATEFLTEAISKTLETITSNVERSSGILGKRMAASLFEAFPGASVGELGGSTLSGGIAGLQGLGSKFFTAIQETKVAIEGAGEKFAEQGWLLASEMDLLGKNFASLDVFDPAGARNVSAFLEIGSQIRNFVSESLQSGRNLDEVINLVRFFRDDLVSGAGRAGVDMNTINVLLNQLGLSEQALIGFYDSVLAAKTETERLALAAEAAAKAEEASEAAEKAKEEADKQRAREMELLRIAAAGSARPINVMLPYGDPQAAALAVSNRIAYDLSAGI